MTPITTTPDTDPERILIALLLKYPDETLNEASGIVDATMFSTPFYRNVWEVVEANLSDSKPVSVRVLRRDPKLSKRAEDLRGLLTEAVTAAHLTFHVAEMVDLVSRRRLLKIAQLIDDRISTASATQLAEEVIGEITGILTSNQAEERNWKSAQEVLHLALTSIEASQARGGQLIGYRTGLPYLDQLLGGLQTKRLYVVAGRPAKGKSVMAMQIAAYACRYHKIPVAVFSLEMPAEEVGQRLISAESEVPIGEMMGGIEDGRAKASSYIRISQSVSVMAGMSLHVRDYHQLSALSLRIEVRKIVQQHGIKIIVLDYLQLCQMRGDSNERRLQLGEITKTCKQLSKQYDLAFVVVSQLGRSADGKQQMSLSQLADSDEIGRDADAVLCINDDQDLDVVKNRSGPTGLVPLHFTGDTFKFLPGEFPDSK